MSDKIIHYINLTNGLLALADQHLAGKDYRFIRIQSTWFEQHRWDDIIMTLSDDFLMNAALGNTCLVYDYGARKPIPRAVWQGLEWIKYALHACWIQSSVAYKPEGRAYQQRAYFEYVYYKLSAQACAKLRYYRQFYREGTVIDIRSITAATEYDNNILEHIDLSQLYSG